MNERKNILKVLFSKRAVHLFVMIVYLYMAKQFWVYSQLFASIICSHIPAKSNVCYQNQMLEYDAHALFLRSVAGYRLIDHRHNGDIREKLQIIDINSRIKDYQIKWL
jgi:hypothetical protein